MTPTPQFGWFKGLWALVLVLLGLYGCASTPAKQDEAGYQQIGFASYYAHKFHGRKTASGQRYNENELTAAHRKLPFDTIVHVVNLKNDKRVVVRIIDRGPFVKGRIIDLSYAAARQLGMIRDGVAKVKITTQSPR